MCRELEEVKERVTKVPGKTFWAKGTAGAKVLRGGMRPCELSKAPLSMGLLRL